MAPPYQSCYEKQRQCGSKDHQTHGLDSHESLNLQDFLSQTIVRPHTIIRRRDGKRSRRLYSFLVSPSKEGWENG